MWVWKKTKKDSHNHVYLQEGYINVLGIASFFKKKRNAIMIQFRLYLQQYRAGQICVIACNSVIEVLNIFTEPQFQLT